MMPLDKLRDLFDGPEKISHEYFEILTNDFLTRHHHPLAKAENCLLYTSPSPRDVEESRMPSSA